MAQTEFFQSRRIIETPTSLTQERVYTVDSHDPADALSDPDIPEMGDSHPDRNDIFVVERRAETISPTDARVTIVYSREQYQSGNVGDTETRIDIGAEQTRVYWTVPEKSHDKPQYIVDYTTNEAGVNVYRPLAVLEFTEYQTWFDWLKWADITSCINKFLWRGMAARTVRYDGAQGERVGTEKWRVAHRFTYNPRGINIHWHKLKKVEEKVPSGEEDELGEPILVDAYHWEAELDDKGLPVYNEVRVYEEIDFYNYWGNL